MKINSYYGWNPRFTINGPKPTNLNCKSFELVFFVVFFLSTEVKEKRLLN